MELVYFPEFNPFLNYRELGAISISGDMILFIEKKFNFFRKKKIARWVFNGF